MILFYSILCRAVICKQYSAQLNETYDINRDSIQASF